MNQKQFGDCLKVLEATYSKPISKEQAAIYWATLSDLPLETLRIAVKATIATHKYPTLPTPAQLRQAAADAVCDQNALTAADAWEMARYVAGKVDPWHSGPWLKKVGSEWKEYPSQTAAALDGVLMLVAKAITQIGVAAISGDKEGVVRSHFLKAFEQNAEKHKRLAMLPPALAAEIQALGANHIPGITTMVEQIGVER